MSRRSFRNLIAILVLAGVYFAAGSFGLSKAKINPSASAVWPPTGIALAVLLLSGFRLWPGVFLGALLVNFHVQGSFLTATGIALGNTLEALCGAWLVQRFAQGTRAFDHTKTIFQFILAAAIGSTAISATIGVTTLWLSGLAESNNFWSVWATWWLGDMVGNLIVAPLILIWMRRPLPHLKPNALVEAVLLLLVIVAIAQVVFFGRTPFGGKNAPLEYLAILPLLWASFRFDQRGAITGSFIFSAIALWGTLSGLGPFAAPDANQSLLLLQSFMGIMTITSLVMASLNSERKRAEQRILLQDAISRGLAESTSLAEATPKIFQALFEIGGWEVGAVWKVTESGRQIACTRFWHNPALHISEFEQITRTIKFDCGVGLPGRVWSSGQAAWIPDVQVDDNFPRAPAARKEGLRAGLCFPIKLGPETIGAIECFSRQIREPDKALLEMLVAPGQQIGQFIKRKRAEEALRRSERELADLFENATLGLHWIGPNGIILRANRAELSMLGYSAEEYVGHPIAEFHADGPNVSEILKRLNAGEILEEYPARMKCKDGRIRDVRVSSSVYWENGKFVHTRSFTRDVTELEQARAALKAHAESLEKTVGERTAQLEEAIQELEAFSYSISHDMRAPLRAMQGYSQVLLDDYADKLAPEAVGFLQKISASALRQDRLIQDVLSYSRVVHADLHLKAVDLDKLVREIIGMSPDWSPPRAEISIEAPLPAVLGNDAFLTQCVTNLLANAVKFVRDGESPRVRIWAEAPDHQVRICFQDNGIGIADKDQTRIFAMFERAHGPKHFEGTGIGLAIVRKAVERMKGKVGVESEPGKGSRFWLELQKAY